MFISPIIIGQTSYAILFLSDVMFHMEHLVFKKCILLIVLGNPVMFSKAGVECLSPVKKPPYRHMAQAMERVLTGKGDFIVSSPK